VSDLHREWVLICATKICLIFLSNICFGVWSLQAVSVDFMLSIVFNFSEQHPLWCPILTASECWFCVKSAWFFWAASALVSNLYREWVLILWHQICFILLSDICFGVWSLQGVSVDLCLQIWSILLSDICFGVWSLQFVSLDCATKSVWFFWATSALVSDLYSLWVLILCHQICLILLNHISFGVQSLQAVSVDMVPPTLFHFAE